MIIIPLSTKFYQQRYNIIRSTVQLQFIQKKQLTQNQRNKFHLYQYLHHSQLRKGFSQIQLFCNLIKIFNYHYFTTNLFRTYSHSNDHSLISNLSTFYNYFFINSKLCPITYYQTEEELVILHKRLNVHQASLYFEYLLLSVQKVENIDIEKIILIQIKFQTMKRLSKIFKTLNKQELLFKGNLILFREQRFYTVKVKFQIIFFKALLCVLAQSKSLKEISSMINKQLSYRLYYLEIQKPKQYIIKDSQLILVQTQIINRIFNINIINQFMSLKQQLIHNHGPFPFDFRKQKKENFQKLINLLSKNQRDRWMFSGFNFGSMIESYKQVYGITSQQMQTLLTILSNIFYTQNDNATEPRLVVLKLLNRLIQYHIQVTPNFHISNKKLMNFWLQRIKFGSKDPLKHQDGFLEQLSKYTLQYTKYGEQFIQQALKIATEKKQIKFLVLFLGSVKSIQKAQIVIKQMFIDTSLWERDTSWFYIVSQLLKSYPKIDLSKYYDTIFQEIIKTFTSIIEPISQDDVKKITSNDSTLGIRGILKSIAILLVNLILPQSQPQSGYIWSCIQRIFNIITTSLDHINEPSFIYEQLIFMKNFTKFYLNRYRKERKMFVIKNQDFLQDFNEQITQTLLIDKNAQQKFNNLWPEIIPKILFFEDSDSFSAKIIAQLAMYNPDFYLPIILNSAQQILQRQDVNMVSFYATKMSILFLQEYIFLDAPDFSRKLIECYEMLLKVLQKLGISENLDMLELIFRGFLHMSNELIQSNLVQNLIQDIIVVVLQNLTTMSIGLESSQLQQAQLYIDFCNIYFPFFIKLNEEQINKFQDKFLFKITNQIPTHRQAFELITIVLAYIRPQFTAKLFKYIYKQLITTEKPKDTMKNADRQLYFIQKVPQMLCTKNQNHVKWYTTLLQCLYQYHPENIVRDFQKIQKIITVLLTEWDNSTFIQIAMDILFNLIICLSHIHFDSKQFWKPCNNNYKTLNINWKTQYPEGKQLLIKIYKKYFLNLIAFMKERYEKMLPPRFSDTIKYIIDNKQYRIQVEDLNLIDSLIVPNIPSKIQKSQKLQQKKLIYNVLSIQYTVLSAFMIRVPFFQNCPTLNGAFFNDDIFKTLRKDSCQYLQWVVGLLQSHNILWQPNNIKLFNYFWRQSLDEVFFSTPLNTTTQRIAPYYYPQAFKKKQLLRNSFLIINEVYLVYMARLQFLLDINPVAHFNHPQHLKKHYFFGFHTAIEPVFHSFVPQEVNLHSYHKNLMLICRYLVDPLNERSYAFKYLNSSEKRQKQKYLTAIRLVLTNVKKYQNVYSTSCCMKDPFMWESMLALVDLCKVFQKKNQKTIVIEIFYLMLVFGFDNNLMGTYQRYNLQKSLTTAQNTQFNRKQQFSYLQKIYQVKIETRESQMEIQGPSLFVNGLKKTLSFRIPNVNEQVKKNVQQYLKKLIQRLSINLQNLEKNGIIHCLMVIIYSNYLDLCNPLMGKIIKILFNLSLSEMTEIFDVCKVGLFHILNRFNSTKKISKEIQNTPIKRSFQQFLTFRFLGGDPQQAKDINYYKHIVLDKEQNYFYPSKVLHFYKYGNLCDDIQSLNYQNQKIFLQSWNDYEKMMKFITQCAHDKDLKQTQSEISSSIFQDQAKGISSNGHKLLNFILDSNPKKIDIFSSFIQNFSLYSLNFYPRMIRKIIRMGDAKTRQNLIKISKTLRNSDQIQQVKMSLYVATQLMLVLEQKNQFFQDYIQYLATCSNQIFQFSIQCLFIMFYKNFVISQTIYKHIIARLREQKGSSRLRHLTVLNIYIMSQGRFSRQVAKQGISQLLNGIQEGSDQISEALVTMIVNCFVIAINLKEFHKWVNQKTFSLLKQKRLHKLNEDVGYQIDDSLRDILNQIVNKTKVQQNLEAKNLKIYSKIANKVLGSITVYKFNQSFYQLLKDLISYVVQKVPENGQTDEEIILQLKSSEYPESIYRDMIEKFSHMQDNPPSTMRKKLKLIQGLAINYCYSVNKIQIPQILKINQKNLTLQHIVAVSNICRIMTKNQIINEVQKQMSIKDKDIHKLMALLLAAGVRQYQWKQNVLREILKYKKLKIVKEFISYWWKAKTPETQEEKRIQMLVQGVENPYSYFA